jgi:hypothetical protein
MFMIKVTHTSVVRCMSFLIILSITLPAWPEIPVVLTDTINKGNGTIDIFKDITSAELKQYLQGGTVFLGVDLNENASGNESSNSVGVAIKELELLISTDAGVVTYNSFYTNTTAMIQEMGGSQPGLYYTLFGSTGSNALTGSSGFDLSSFDDVIEIENINIDSEILGAQLRISFLDTADGGENESFFDYSGGFEDFALLIQSDAATLESADIGIDTAPEFITVTKDTSESDNAIAASGAPEPYWFLLLIIPLLLYRRKFFVNDPVK